MSGLVASPPGHVCKHRENQESVCGPCDSHQFAGLGGRVE